MFFDSPSLRPVHSAHVNRRRVERGVRREEGRREDVCQAEIPQHSVYIVCALPLLDRVRDVIRDKLGIEFRNVLQK